MALYVTTALSTASTALAAAASAYPGGGPTATISQGVVIGTTTSLPAATATVNKFLGIPFAKTPPERFGPPESPPASGEPIMAQQWSPACMQQFLYPKKEQEFVEYVFNNPAPKESEDCLYVSIHEIRSKLSSSI